MSPPVPPTCGTARDSLSEPPFSHIYSFLFPPHLLSSLTTRPTPYFRAFYLSFHHTNFFSCVVYQPCNLHPPHTHLFKMPSSTAPAAPTAVEEARLRQILESQSLKFHIKAGNSKWACTITDRATHERQKASRASSSSSVNSDDSAASTISK